MSERLKHISVIVLCLTLAVCIVIVTPTLRGTLLKAQETAGETKRAATALADYAEFQTEQFQSERYQKSLKATVDTGAFANSVMRSLNVRVIPELITMLRKLQGTTDQSTVTLASLERFIADLNKRTNGDDGLIVAATQLLDGINKVAARFEVTVEELSTAIKIAAEKSGKSLDAVYALIADPKMQEILLHWNEMSARGSEILADVKLAADRAPSIAASLDSIAKTSSKFTKITLISNVLATLARAFLP